ncbi:hypothetical protein [Pedobacter kyonggii]|uniref:Uncharacterized protein n=1 Tax=Pedobacter kyonggii TaxID=1926871 RepID=A0A4Q9HGU2_9SPHI|nr:hypothetical protein [Pedobacter kyonggii]TBO44437.1 hypothetical protein EYS08_03775 [Pedobacter kyonggii]
MKNHLPGLDFCGTLIHSIKKIAMKNLKTGVIPDQKGILLAEVIISEKIPSGQPIASGLTRQFVRPEPRPNIDLQIKNELEKKLEQIISQRKANENLTTRSQNAIHPTLDELCNILPPDKFHLNSLRTATQSWCAIPSEDRKFILKKFRDHYRALHQEVSDSQVSQSFCATFIRDFVPILSRLHYIPDQMYMKNYPARKYPSSAKASGTFFSHPLILLLSFIVVSCLMPFISYGQSPGQGDENRTPGDFSCSLLINLVLVIVIVVQARRKGIHGRD